MNIKKNIGFIGAGLMGYGMAINLLKNKYNLKVISHKNKKPIKKLVRRGAIEVKNYKELCRNTNNIILCVSNTKISLAVTKELSKYLNKNSLIIDITTNNPEGSKKIEKNLEKFQIKYIESPVMGGPIQAKKGVLGAMVGCKNKQIFKRGKLILNSFCKNVIYFGPVGVAAKSKLINNFLSLGTATLVIETVKHLNKFNVDIKKFYKVAKLGSGNSGALQRILDQVIKNNYKGYIFTVNNTFKDLSYINELLNKYEKTDKVSLFLKNYYKRNIIKGNGKLLISELIKK